MGRTYHYYVVTTSRIGPVMLYLSQDFTKTAVVMMDNIDAQVDGQSYLVHTVALLFGRYLFFGRAMISC